MLKIAVCDDNIQELKSTFDMVEDYVKDKAETDISISRFQSCYDLLECVEIGRGFHIYLLDILMPEMSGIDIGIKIREKDENAIIIYLTSSPDYAIKSYGVFAFQYLLKPVSGDELHKVLDKALNKINIESALSLPVKTSEGLKAIRYQQIVFVEYKNHTLKFHLSDCSVINSTTSREPFDIMISAILKDSRFVRPHASFVVNMSFVRAITARDFVMTDGSLVSISHKNYTDIKKRYINFLLNGMMAANASYTG